MLASESWVTWHAWGSGLPGSGQGWGQSLDCGLPRLLEWLAQLQAQGSQGQLESVDLAGRLGTLAQQSEVAELGQQMAGVGFFQLALDEDLGGGSLPLKGELTAVWTPKTRADDAPPAGVQTNAQPTPSSVAYPCPVSVSWVGSGSGISQGRSGIQAHALRGCGSGPAGELRRLVSDQLEGRG